RVVTQYEKQICQAVPSCLAKTVDLVHYPNTLAPSSVSRSKTVAVQCADNAHVRTGSSLSVRCNYNGNWSTDVPHCDCDDGYRPISEDNKMLCEATVCEAKSVGLVRYPATFGGSVADLQCADNAHSNSSNNMRVLCNSIGVWSDHSLPECLCDDKYRIVNRKGEGIICEAIPSCQAKIEGLVRYPNTLAPKIGSDTVIAECADNAQRTSTSLNVTCLSNGEWSGVIPQCECDLEYYRATISDKQICLAIPPTLCEAMSEGLVRYPNWIAPLVGTETVATQCADNAHRTSTSLNVTCTSDGIWSGPIPVCECDDEHHVSTADDGRDICKGDNLMFTMISLLTVSGGALLILLTLITITILAIRLLKVSIKRPKHSESYDQLWVRTANNSGGFPTSSTFGMSNIMGTREDDEDEEDCSPSSQPPNKSLETRLVSTSRQVDNMEGVVFPSHL
ncbi:hypothetical protein GBAR_LOCUS14067, partial [Geodia barretti]